MPRPLHEALWHWYSEFDAEALVAAYAVTGQTPEPGIIRNFLGTRIEPLVYPPVLTRMAGTVEGPPAPGNWHADIAEWGAALRSVDLARGSYRIVELGCGWGCWITNMGVAARSRGLTLDLVGVEGDAAHLDHARQTLALNGLAPDSYRLIHGIAAARPGRAIFPKSDGSGWGNAAVFDADAATLARAARDPAVQVLDCVTLARAAGGGAIDLLHIDIQGAEADFVAGNLDQMAAHVRRVLIGTHSRSIEGRLMDLFLTAGWRIEMERPAIAPLLDGRPEIRIDGVQMWMNPALG